ncbi:glycine betaine ABC transporter substrate-binding protein [Paraburkholderia fungorum]|uniref:glycine betaine ABC transporter substrate-binding protein n=1 Tax=Paraburkholderia fungorum TaxID=134537 RepID=UPI001C1ED685|nr:glycine betaine ABC transporter substrate-binding protein [Paraburkholderia fungorum]MBU7435861.1 glycine/betaine ABC transporter substrate-binding protein [Paraburkholderia fungorum]
MSSILKSARLALPLIFPALMASASTSVFAKDPETCQRVRIADTGWTDLAVTNAVASTLLSALGYKPELMRVSVPISFVGLSKKQVDVSLGYWRPNQEDALAPYLKDKTVTVLQPANLVGAKSSLAVPTYEYEAGLKNLKDLPNYYKELDGKIYGIEAGSSANKLLQNLIATNSYGLGKFQLIESSESAMLVAVKRAIQAKRWIVFWGWEPHPMNDEIQMTYLASNEASAHDATVYTLTSEGYADRCSNAAKLFSNLHFDLKMENQLMAPVLKGEQPQVVVKAYMKQHPQLVSQWINGVSTFDGEDAQKAVSAALAK